MQDDVTKVQISKTDITGEKEIPGAKLTILDKDDQVVESWTSAEEAHYIRNFRSENTRCERNRHRKDLS